jgi:imidazolonepropionase
MSLILVHSARQLLTMHGPPGPRRGPALDELHIVPDGAVLIEDAVIREVGLTRRLENLAIARKAREVSAAGRVVMPGFVDSHTHLISGPPHLKAKRLPVTEPEAQAVLANLPSVRDATRRRMSAEGAAVLRQCLAHGTTTIEAKSGSALNAGGETKILRALTNLGEGPIDVVPTFFGANVVPPEFAGRRSEFIAWLSQDLLPVIHRRGLARFVDGCCDAGAFSAGELRPYYEAARNLGFALKLHGSQFGPTDATELLTEFDFASIDHLDHLDESEITRVFGSSAVVTLTPAASFLLGAKRIAPARQLIAAGVPVAIASSFNPMNSPVSSMQLVVYFACRELRMTPAEAITAATINGAHALKLGHRIGSIEAGKQADLLILNANDYRDLAFQFGVNLVGVTMKRGVVVFDSSGVRWPAQS